MRMDCDSCPRAALPAADSHLGQHPEQERSADEGDEDGLRRAGLPTYRATGKGYFGQQQVVDLLMYLRLLHNRYDDAALLSVLASPFVGVSNDALALLRRVASRRPLFSGLDLDVAGLATITPCTGGSSSASI